jgi:glycerol-3-phosphate dehydrogenase
MSREFSWRTREANLARMRGETFDVLVIGGGIVGAAVARDATTRGLATALVERGDFASGTSGKTSRLIHGGLRYLRDFRIPLVRQSVRERDRLLRVAPALVVPLRFVIPVYAEKGLRTWSLRLGLFVYEVLSRERTLPRGRWLSPRDVVAEEPSLSPEGLRGGGLYFDACADDARLVLAVVRDAAEAGAAVANYAEAVELIRAGERVAGARVRARAVGDPFEVRARCVVNATGVWLDRLRGGGEGHSVRPTRGAHILVPRDRVGNVDGVALTAKRDRRVMFVVPWGGWSLVGTTDTDYGGEPDRVRPDPDDIAYLLESVNEAFPDARLTPDDIASAYAGLRPLVRRAGRGDGASDVSRAHEVFEDPDGLLSVAGGKLTTQRAIGEDVVDLVCERLGLDLASATRDRPLGPAMTAAAEFRSIGFDDATADHLASRHDPSDLRTALEEPESRARIDPHLPYVWAEVHGAVHAEMALTLEDVLVRRLPIFYESRDQGGSVAVAVAARVARLVGWDAERIQAEIRGYATLIEEHRAFRRDPRA